jgi:acyl-coenzyme A synthetase/AMP-(fatty) acid ligase/thioesterase domain-containing protein/acyl carrier protein
MNEFLTRFQEMVETVPSKIAASDPERELSYLELDADSDRLARLLREADGSPNPVFAYLGTMTVECVSLNTAAGKAGIALVALNPAHPEAELRELIAHSGAVRIVTTELFREQALRVMDTPPVLIPTDPPKRDEIPRFEPVETSPDALHFISYTSGSTGRPKAIPVTRRITDYRCSEKRRLYGTRADDVISTVNTFWWYKQAWPLTVGAEAACFDFARYGIKELENWMRTKKVTIFSTYVAMCRELLFAASAPLPDVRQVVVGGEPVRVEDIRQFDKVFTPGSEFLIRLACQELGPITLFRHRHGDPIDYDTVPLGHILRPDMVRLLDEDGEEVKPGAVGEITASGPFVPPGYHNDPERTKAAFRQEADGTWTFIMGDLAMVGEDGILRSMGRKDHQVKIRGYNVRPHEVEEKLERHPGVAKSAVISFESKHGTRRLAAYIVAAEGHDLTPADLRRYLAEFVPNYQVPSFFFFREALPRNAAGKLDRQALLPLEDIAAAEPNTSWDEIEATETERELLHIWRDVLGHSEFSLGDDFFDVGGDSLQAMTMLLQTELRFGVQLPMETLPLEGASIEAISQRIAANKQGGRTNAPYLLRPGGSLPPLYLAHVRGGHLSDYLSLVAVLDKRRPIFGLHPKGINDGASPAMAMRELAEHSADMIAGHATGADGVRLMGFSFGGMLAFETAHVLSQRGIEVSHLVLLDPPAPWRRPFRNLRALNDYIKGQRTGLTHRRMLGTARAAFGLGPVPANLDEAHFIAGWRYRPEPLALPKVLLVLAKDDNIGVRGMEDWKRLVGSKPTVLEHSGTHMTFIRPPLVKPLAAKIDAWLEDDGHRDGAPLEASAQAGHGG